MGEFPSPPIGDGPLQDFELRSTSVVNTFDELLPPSVALREFVINREFSSTHKIVLVEQNSPDMQLGYMVLQQLYSDALWWSYMQKHNLADLWVDRRDLVSLVQHRGIGTVLWNVSHRVIRPGGYRAIIDTSNGWTKRKIEEAQKQGVFRLHHTDNVLNYGKSYKRYLVEYK